MADNVINFEEAVQVAKLETRVEALHLRNKENMNTINQLGGMVDTSEARLETLMNYLVEIGVITRLQLLQEQEAWELKLRAQLQPIIDRLKEQQLAAMQQARAHGMDVQTQTGLILPGHGKQV